MNFATDRAIGARIRNLREERGITQTELAAKLQVAVCDVTRSALAKIEVGQRHIYTHEIKALRGILKVTYEELLD